MLTVIWFLVSASDGISLKIMVPGLIFSALVDAAVVGWLL